MRLARLRAHGYRCLGGVDISFGETTVLIGGNAAGKTSALEAIDKVFGVGRRGYGFREEDLEAGQKRLYIDFELRPDDDLAFTTEEHGLFETHVDLDDDGREVVFVRAEAGFDEDGVFRSHATFQKSDGLEDGILDSVTRSELAFFYLPAARDARREFDDRGGLWARLASLIEGAHDPERLEQLSAEAGRGLVSAVLGEERLAELSGTVQTFVRAMYGSEDVSAELRATAVDFRALLRRTLLVVGTADAQTPLQQHSTGLQTLALFGLFRAYVETAGGHMLASGLEEPEIHLAPHVARSLMALATEGEHQVIFTTHSPVVTDRVTAKDVRVLRRDAGTTVVRQIPDGLYTAEELARLHRELRIVGTEFLFSRAVLLCEGASELGALPEFALKMALDLDRLGVSLLHVGGGGFKPYLKLLSEDSLAIPHVVLCDNDRVLKQLMKTLNELGRLPEGVDAKGDLDEAGLDALRQVGVVAWSKGDLEAYLISEGGYPRFVEAADFLYGPGDLAAFRKAKVADGVPDGDVEVLRLYTKQRDRRKPELAAEAARRFDEVPPEVAALLEIAAARARGTDPPAAEPAE